LYPMFEYSLWNPYPIDYGKISSFISPKTSGLAFI
jgi:hypothetical protein